MEVKQMPGSLTAQKLGSANEYHNFISAETDPSSTDRVHPPLPEDAIHIFV